MVKAPGPLGVVSISLTTETRPASRIRNGSVLRCIYIGWVRVRAEMETWGGCVGCFPGPGPDPEPDIGGKTILPMDDRPFAQDSDDGDVNPWLLVPVMEGKLCRVADNQQDPYCPRHPPDNGTIMRAGTAAVTVCRVRLSTPLIAQGCLVAMRIDTLLSTYLSLRLPSLGLFPRSG